MTSGFNGHRYEACGRIWHRLFDGVILQPRLFGIETDEATPYLPFLTRVPGKAPQTDFLEGADGFCAGLEKRDSDQ